jgi:uncharacterized protein YuzE
MKKPTSVEIDIQHRLGYVYYQESSKKVAETIDVWREGRVAADLDDAGNVVGIELLGFDDNTLEHARKFAAEHELAFPTNLAASLEVA